MIRRAFALRLRPDALDEYRRLHANLWPELVDEFGRSGISRITAYHRDQDLWVISESREETSWRQLMTSEIAGRWLAALKPLLDHKEDGSLDLSPLGEVWHLEPAAAPAAEAKASANKSARRGRRAAKKKVHSRARAKVSGKKTKPLAKTAKKKKIAVRKTAGGKARSRRPK